ncbi:MAG: septal ring lytic transglycosylase RlpA family protein [Bacteroidetes bacterium]|nr:septal ring lytic transglycosylase RlpA family protein [Bacteroidota bacterium]
MFFSLKDSLAGSSTDEFDENEVTISANTERTIDIELKNKGNMIASWYGPKFHGKVTANGEIYDQMSMTAAHKNMPFGTMLKLTNPRNGKSVVVRINDRGPYIKGRQLDLSKGAATVLGMLHKGVVKIQVEELVMNDFNNPVIAMN